MSQDYPNSSLYIGGKIPISGEKSSSAAALNYGQSTNIRCVGIRGVLVLEVCWYCRCVCISGVLVLEVCWYYMCVCIRGVLVLEVCRY